MLSLRSLSAAFAAATISLSPILFVSSATSALAQDAAPKVTDVSIRYNGPQTVAPERLRGMIGVQVGQELSIDRTEEDIRALIASGEVEDVRVLQEDFNGGVRVIYMVETRAGLDNVSFVGNSAVTSAKLREQIELTAGQTVRTATLIAGKEKIEELYVRRGFSDVSVSYRIEPTTREGFQQVTYFIEEGGKGYVRDIVFEGNTVFKDSELRKQMETKEKGIFSFLTKSGQVDKFTLETDIAKIEAHYRNAGYLRAKVVSYNRVPVEDGKVDLVITISEGEVYTVTDIAVQGLRIFAPSEITPEFLQKSGTPYSSKDVEADRDLILAYYGSRGYADADVAVDLRETGERQVGITYSVTEGGKSFVRRVDISGNIKTQDKVIRRNVTLAPGDPLNTVELATSRSRLMNTGYFSNVTVSPSISSEPGFRDINVNVEEQNTGSISIGAGFSSIDSIVGGFTLTQTNFDLLGWPNFTGGGQRFVLDLRLGTERRDFTLSLEEPYFMDRQFAIGGELFFRDLLYLSDDYEQQEYGESLYIRKPLGEFSYLKLQHTLQNVRIHNIDSGASDIIRAEEGDYLQSKFSVSYVLDTRDNIQLTRRGHKLNASVNYSGLFGDVDTYGFAIDGIKYYQLPYDLIFSVQGQLAFVDGDEVPIFERLFLGGARNLRGFDYRDVGPKDENGEPIGGQSSAFVSAEVTFPIIESVRGAVFYDLGMVSSDAFDIGGDINSNVGIGLRLNLPFGPLALDFGVPIQSDEFNDSGGKFQFTVGYKF